MGKGIAEFIFLLGVSVLALAIAFPFGPLGWVSTTIAVSDGYLALAKNQELYLGVVGFLAAFSINLWLKANYLVVAASALLGGALFFLLGQSGDPDFLSYLGVAMASFLANYLFAGVFVVMCFGLHRYVSKRA